MVPLSDDEVRDAIVECTYQHYRQSVILTDIDTTDVHYRNILLLGSRALPFLIEQLAEWLAKDFCDPRAHPYFCFELISDITGFRPPETAASVFHRTRLLANEYLRLWEGMTKTSLPA